jgi:hypothetical protein
VLEAAANVLVRLRAEDQFVDLRLQMAQALCGQGK